MIARGKMMRGKLKEGAMDFFQSFYDRNGDGKLTGFERVRYEEDNWAYPGSLVPHTTTTDPELKKDLGYDEDDDDKSYSSIGSYYDDDFDDADFDEDDDWDDDDDDDDDDWDGFSIEHGDVLDDFDDFGEENRYWFAPRNSEDLIGAIDTPKYLEEPRVRAHRCYNCRHWIDTKPTCNTRDDGCRVYYRLKIDRILKNDAPDLDGEVCDHFEFRHGDRG